MYKILLFAGTSEGRELAVFIKEKKIPACVFTATEYGKELIESSASLDVRSGRLDRTEMEKIFREYPDAIVIDATHPYAELVTETIREACAAAGNQYQRVIRETNEENGSSDEKAVCQNAAVAEENNSKKADVEIIRVKSAQDAAAFLAETEGNVLLTTGSKELAVFGSVPHFTERVYARVLSLPKVVEACAALGLKGAHLICMQGPFSAELNEAMIRQYDIRYLVTKETGAKGGFPEKIEAAGRCGCRVIVIGRPEETEGISVEEMKQMISRICPEFAAGGTNQEKISESPKAGLQYPEERSFAVADSGAPESVREVVCIGTGCGPGMLTCEASQYLNSADLLIGAERMVREHAREDQPVYIEYRAENIVSYILEHEEFNRIAVLFSGDTGFYSGAGLLLRAFGKEAEAGGAAEGSLRFENGEESIRVRMMPGVSSVSALSARTGVSWQDACILSVHGRSANVTGHVLTNRKTFCLAGTKEDVREIAGNLLKYHMGHVRMTAGTELGLPDEEIIRGTPESFLGYDGSPLCVLLLENDRPESGLFTGIPDEQFIRGNVPMTKEEVRRIVLSKLHLTDSSVVYDIGAGTGSISVEAARAAVNGTVYAVEKKEEACELLERNKVRFAADNLILVRGGAPEALRDLPLPDSVMIGGSGGKTEDILRLLAEKRKESLPERPAADSPSADKALYVVADAITIETVSETLTALRNTGFEEIRVTQVFAARSKEAGRYHMMIGQNPVSVISAVLRN